MTTSSQPPAGANWPHLDSFGFEFMHFIAVKLRSLLLLGLLFFILILFIIILAYCSKFQSLLGAKGFFGTFLQGGIL